MISHLVRCIYWRVTYKAKYVEALSAKAELQHALIVFADYIFALHEENQALKRRKKMEVVK